MNILENHVEFKHSTPVNDTPKNDLEIHSVSSVESVVLTESKFQLTFKLCMILLLVQLYT